MSEEILENLEPYIANSMFNKEEIEKQSIAASTMVVWIIAINQYCGMRKIVKPKLDVLNAAQKKLRYLVQGFSENKSKLDEAEKASSEIEETIQAKLYDKVLRT